MSQKHFIIYMNTWYYYLQRIFLLLPQFFCSSRNLEPLLSLFLYHLIKPILSPILSIPESISVSTDNLLAQITISLASRLAFQLPLFTSLQSICNRLINLKSHSGSVSPCLKIILQTPYLRLLVPYNLVYPSSLISFLFMCAVRFSLPLQCLRHALAMLPLPGAPSSPQGI